MAVISGEDIKQVVRAKLLENAAVSGIVADRIYGHHLQQSENPTTSMPLVIIEHGGGEGQYNRQVQRVRLMFWCYSAESASEAMRLADAVYEAMHAEALEITNVPASGLMTSEGRPVEMWNAQLEAYCCRLSFTFSAVS